MNQSSDIDDSSVQVGKNDKREKPAIGIVATGENDDEVARICLRARTHGYEVFITYDNGGTPNLGDLNQLEGITVIPPNGGASSATNPKNATARLEVMARTKASNGLILVENTAAPIDFKASLAEHDSDTYLTLAVPEPATGVQTLVAIPAYNESETIGTVAQKASNHADKVLVIDDGSADETAANAESAGATVVSHERNRGYGAALKTAFETADSWNVECLAILDGDDQHDVSDVPNLCSRVRDAEANIAIGSRFAGDVKSDIPLYRRFGLGVLNVFSNVSMGMFDPRLWVSDTQSGFRAYDEHAIEALANADLGDDMDASLEILYQVQAEGFEIIEEATTVDYDVDNGHSQNPVKHGFRLVSTILRTVEQDHPVKFLGVPGFIGVLLGVGFSYATVANFITTGTFPLALGLLSVFFILAGVFAAFTAIILHSLNQLHE